MIDFQNCAFCVDRLKSNVNISIVTRHESSGDFGGLAPLFFLDLNPLNKSILGKASCFTENRLCCIHSNGRTVFPTFKKRHCMKEADGERDRVVNWRKQILFRLTVAPSWDEYLPRLNEKSSRSTNFLFSKFFFKVVATSITRV